MQLTQVIRLVYTFRLYLRFNSRLQPNPKSIEKQNPDNHVLTLIPNV